MGCHFLLQRIFPTKGLNLGLLHCRQTLYRPSYPGSLKEKKKKKGKDTNKQKYITCSWIGRVNTVLKCPYYPESPIDLMQSLIKFQWHFSQKQIQSPNSYGTKNDSEYWKESRETTTWGIMFSDFKHYYKDIGIKILWYYH